MKTITERLASIQLKLNAPKSQENKFGGYKYRSCEDILTAVKPLLEGLAIIISDEVISVADRIYVKATATITDGENHVSATAFAREAATKKGMDDSQITGSTSSYARKYALNGLLLIDDSKDADTMDSKPELLSNDQLQNIESLIEEVKPDVQKLLAAYGVKSLRQIEAFNYLKLTHQLEQKRKAA